MKKIISVLFITLLVSTNAQNETEFFPDDLLIQPYTANIIEPKLGFLFQVGDNELRLDIGNSIDLVRVAFNENEKLSVGADLFTYTLLRGEEDFHFPVDAVDYLFGFNAGYKNTSNDFEFGGRLRFSHISAHLVDGRFNKTLDVWRDGQRPRVYSREFIELMPYIKFDQLRIYTGFTYIINTTPGDIGNDIYQLGFDYFAEDLFLEEITPFIAYDFRLEHLAAYIGTNSINAGIKFGSVNGKGISIYYQFYAGRSVHGEFYDYKKKYSAIGVNIDL